MPLKNILKSSKQRKGIKLRQNAMTEADTVCRVWTGALEAGSPEQLESGPHKTLKSMVYASARELKHQ